MGPVRHALVALLAVAAGLPACSDSSSPPVSAQEAFVPPERLFVLGDSLSDVGNAAAAVDFALGREPSPTPAIGLCNPADALLGRRCDDLFYHQSRVSDGPVAVEHLAAHLGLPELVPSYHALPSRPDAGTSYAVASAKARATGVEDLGRQLEMLLLDHGPLLSGTALFVVAIGGNDAVDALQAAAPPGEAAPGEAERIVAEAVAAIGASLERLIAAGARRFIVVTVPDLAALPAVRARARESGTEAAALAAASAVTRSFNAALGARVAELAARYPDAVLATFDLAAFGAAQRSAAAAAGRNVDEACFDSETYADSGVAERRFHPACEPPPDGRPLFDRFLFWDDLHPTGAAHAEVGAALIELYERAVASPPPA
ncbi:MAG TPA: SGNH/GDSL hydrolase family protein [Gammaproteobacteria bacterium]